MNVIQSTNNLTSSTTKLNDYGFVVSCLFYPAHGVQYWRLWFGAVCAAVTVLATNPMYSQSELNDYSRLGQNAIGTTLVSDYQAIGVNPANLGFIPEEIIYEEPSPLQLQISRRKRNWSVTLGELGVAVHSNAMNRSNLLDAVFSFNSEQFTLADKQKAADNFTGKGVLLNADAILLGGAYQSERYGGVAFSVRERVSAEFTFNASAAQLAFLGRYYSYFDSSYTREWDGTIIGYSRSPKLYSELFDSTRISMMWTREYNVSYGRKIFGGIKNKWYLGIGLKYIVGYANLNSYVDENGQLNAYSAVTPLFNINYGKAVSPSKIDGTGMIPVGRGFGVDIGTTILISNKWRIGISVLDLGRMYWDGNVFKAEDYLLNGMSSTGFNSYNIFTEAQKIQGEGGFKWAGLSSIESTLPTRIRLGVSRNIGVMRDIGMDIIIPATSLQPGNLSEVMFSLGAAYQIRSWLHVNGGFTFGGSMGFNMPAGVMFSIFDGFWELGLSTRDLLTYISAKDPTLSIGVATARFRF
ncbi:MAG: DUF5723 family protein [Candidatus Kapaibacterium sp.]|nr:hypothetical protein [Bacteroidota bacterium]